MKKVYLIAGSAGLALILFLVFAAWRPLAPRELDIFAGPEGTQYHQYATRYAEHLATQGVTAHVVETAGALDNLERLASADGPAIAMAASGTDHLLDPRPDGLASLGSVAFEPLWLFIRNGSGIAGLEDLAGHTVALGPEGSASRAIAELILDASGLLDEVETAASGELNPEEAVDRLLAGEIDAVFILGALHSAPVSRLTVADSVTPVPLERAQAYASHFPFLARLEVPRGAASLAQDQPKMDLEIVAGATNLVVTNEMHTALVGLLVDTARNVATASSLETPWGTFPTMDYASLPIHERAQSVYRDGPSTASRLLPYRLAALVDQLLFVILPALAIPFTILKTLPMAFAIRFSMKSSQLSRRMVAIERRLIAGEDSEPLLTALDEIEKESSTIRVPRSRAAEFLELRQNIFDACGRIEARRESGRD